MDDVNFIINLCDDEDDVEIENFLTSTTHKNKTSSHDAATANCTLSDTHSSYINKFQRRNPRGSHSKLRCDTDDDSSDHHSESNSSKYQRNLDQRMKRQIAEVNRSQFLKDFIPEMSSREMNKQKQRFGATSYSSQSYRSTMYNEKGEFRKRNMKTQDLCDCLSLSCAGCFLPCKKCRSTKCGVVCRCNRKWVIEEIECDGKDLIIKNPILDELYSDN